MRPVPIIPSDWLRQGETGCTQNLDVMIIMDRSSSITSSDFIQTKAFVSAMVSVLQNTTSETRIGLATFSNSPTLINPLTNDAMAVANAIDRMSNTTDGGTEIVPALQLANNQLTADPRADTARVVILLTDGGNQGGITTELLNVAEALRLNNIELVIVAVGDAVPVAEFQQLYPAEILEVTEAAQLNTILGNLTEVTCSAPTADPLGTGGANPDGITTIAPPDDGGSDLPIIPIVLGALAALLLLAGLFALLRRKKPSEFIGGATGDQAPRDGNLPPTVDYSSWLSRLDRHAMPGPAESFAKFHTKTLVIGIGNMGADVLSQVVERIDDTNTQPQIYYAPHARSYATETGVQRQLAMLHIDMPNVVADGERTRSVQASERWRQAMVDQLSIKTKPDDREPSQEQREWAALLDARSTQSLNRQTAKLALFNAFRLGRKGAQDIFAKLENYLNAGFKDIILVASPYDMVGANIMGDVATLLRAVKPERTDLHVYAFVPLEDTNNQGQLLRYNERALKTATLHELGRLSTPAGIQQRTSLGPDISYTVPERDAMIDAMIVFGGENCNQRLGNMLWGTLISPNLFKEVTQRTRDIDPNDEYVPSTGISVTRSIIQPIHLIRELLVSKLMLALIGSGEFRKAKPTINPCTTDTINAALDNVRGDGYLAMIRLLEESPTCAPQHKDFLIQLRRVFMQARTQYERNVRTYTNDIRQYARGNNSRLSMYDVATWEAQTFPSDLRDYVLLRVGFAARRSSSDLERGLLINMMVAPNRSLDYNHREDLVEYINAIEDMVRTSIINRELASPTKESLRTLTNPRFGTTARDWHDQYQKWVQEVNTMLQAQGLRDAYWFSYNTPANWTEDPVVDLAVNPQEDSTFAVQGALFSRVPLKSFTDLATITHNHDLVHPTEAIVRDVFASDLAALKEVPVPLQSALTRRVDMWRFYEAWRVAGRAKMVTALGLPDASFEVQLKQFFSWYGNDYANFRSKVASYINAADGEPVTARSAAADFDNHTFDKYLKQAFDAFAQGKTRYFPPDTLY